MTNAASAALCSHTFDICKPFLSETGTNAFSYSRIFEDGTRCELWSDTAAFNHTFHRARYIVGAYTPRYFAPYERYSILDHKIESYPLHLRSRYRRQLADQREHFDHDHCFAILRKGEEFCEYFIFYAPRQSHGAINFYLNNLDRFESFSDHFLSTSTRLIEQADQHRIGGFIANGQSEMTPICGDYLSDEHQALTPREEDVAKLLVTGATAREIARTLCISHRTVESHIEHMRHKLGCAKKSLLIKELVTRQAVRAEIGHSGTGP